MAKTIRLRCGIRLASALPGAGPLTRRSPLFALCPALRAGLQGRRRVLCFDVPRPSLRASSARGRGRVLEKTPGPIPCRSRPALASRTAQRHDSNLQVCDRAKALHATSRLAFYGSPISTTRYSDGSDDAGQHSCVKLREFYSCEISKSVVKNRLDPPVRLAGKGVSDTTSRVNGLRAHFFCFF